MLVGAHEPRVELDDDPLRGHPPQLVVERPFVESGCRAELVTQLPRLGEEAPLEHRSPEAIGVESGAGMRVEDLDRTHHRAGPRIAEDEPVARHERDRTVQPDPGEAVGHVHSPVQLRAADVDVEHRV